MSVSLTGRVFLRLRCCSLSVRHRTMSDFSGLSVRCVSGEERMKICFDYSHDGNQSRTFNMDRPQSEEVGKALTRLKANIINKASSKKKKKKPVAESDPEADVPVEFTVNSEPIAETTPNRDAWVAGAQLKIGNTVYVVDINPPSVISLSIPDNIMAGFPIFPSIRLDFADEKDARFVWRRAKPVQLSETTASKTPEPVQFEETVEVSRELIYTPSNEDIGHYLQLSCTPRRGGKQGKEMVITSKVEVSAGPGLCPFDHRHLYTPAIEDLTKFRVVSYNILADLYADSDFSRQQLYPYCPPYALALAYRSQLLLKELKGYNPDILCLQEVDKKVYDNELTTAMTLLGLQGVFRCKGGQVVEGCALFYRTSKFSLQSLHDISINDSLQNSSANADLMQALAECPATTEKILTRTTVLQVAVLASVAEPRRCLVVGNTHLYFHPRADNVRLVQGVVAHRHLQSVCELLRQEGKEPSLIFCGDFNCRPTQGAAKFLMEGHISAEDQVWKSGEDEGTALPGLELRHELRLASGCGLPPYTNYVGGFQGTLDYVFLDASTLSVEAVVPPPEHTEVTQFIALPSLVLPSDHLAQVCDLAWRQNPAPADSLPAAAAAVDSATDPGSGGEAPAQQV